VFDSDTLEAVTTGTAPKTVITMGNHPSLGEGHLIGTYQKWLKIFPFGLGCFQHDKQYFIERFADFISKNEVRTNRYLELTFKVAKTQAELISFLIHATHVLLADVQNMEWINKNSVRDIESKQLELATRIHRIEQEKLLTAFNDEEKVYVKTLKKWLSNEKRYIQELIKMFGRQNINAKLNGVSAKEALPMSIVGKIHELCNGVLFTDVSSAVLYTAFNHPQQDVIHVCKGQKSKMEYLLNRTKNYFYENNLPEDFFDAVCQSFHLKASDCKKRKNLQEDYFRKNIDFMKSVDAIFQDES
jgi:hypothetical protein